MTQRLFIVGAPKCGTTSLARWLARHPAIHMSPIKEPHFFNTDMNNRTITRQADYDALFANAPPEARVLAEASTWYLYSDAAVPNILRAYPDARFIAMTRDPVEMAISLYYHNRFKLHEPLDTIEAAWAAQDRRAHGEDLPRDCVEPEVLQYRKVCTLEPLLQRLRRRVHPEHLLVLRLEDMRADARSAYLGVLKFLGLPDDGRTDFTAQNEARRPRSLFLSRAFKTAVKLKRALGITRNTGLTRINDLKLEKKVVSKKQRAVMEKAFEIALTKQSTA
ncbi:MAG: sulfotransferase [Rhodobacteraceae bacterium]|nr:sulfotransferase [Paracoccaceae bacterium]